MHGIPTKLSLTGRDVAFELPSNSQNTGIKELVGLGMKRLDIDFDLEANWNRSNDTIEVTKFALGEASIGATSGSALVGGATSSLFSDDTATARVAAMGLTARHVQLSLTKGNLDDDFLASIAKKHGVTEKVLREHLAMIAKAAIIDKLGRSAGVARLAESVAAFIDDGHQLSISMTAKPSEGLNAGQLFMLKTTPALFGSEVTVDSSEN